MALAPAGPWSFVVVVVVVGILAPGNRARHQSHRRRCQWLEIKIQSRRGILFRVGVLEMEYLKTVEISLATHRVSSQPRPRICTFF